MKCCIKCGWFKEFTCFQWLSERVAHRNTCKECSNHRRRETRMGENYRKAQESVEYIKSRLLYNAKERAKVKQVPFDITKNDFDIPLTCPVLGIELRVAKGQADDNSPTLDRIIPKLGYIPGNVIVMSYRANRIKSDATLQELDRVADFVRRLTETEEF